MKCTDCPYHWKDEDDKFARCHYEHDDGYAPCEVDEPSDPEDYYGD